jgi:ATP-dependent DNA helicase PIF1
MEITLSERQQEAFDQYRLGENIFITGPGGSGKSALIRLIIKDALERGKNAQVCALTGTAAVLLECNAKTVHSWGGIGLANGERMAVANRVNKNRFKKRNWKTVDLLIVDEVSMMSCKLFEILEITARLCRKNPKPFGGIQVKSTVTKLNSLVGRKVDSSETILPTILYPTRRKVDAINTSSLLALKGDEYVYDYCVAEQKDLNVTESMLSMLTMFSQEQKDRELQYMVDNVNFEKRLVLKEGSQVMCVANIDLDSNTPICNGSQGIIERFDPQDKMPIVRFKNGAIRKMGQHIWQSETIPTIGIKQVPLILAWAITIHKSQGASLDTAEIDVGGGIFECGQTYVALSRLRSMEGLYLKSFDPAKIIIHKKVREFYENLNE